MSYDVIDSDSDDTPVGHPEKMDHHKLSDGEKLFDRVTYTGIGFGVNEASSLWITDQFMHGKNLLSKVPGPLKKAGEWFSQSGYERAGDWLGKTFKMAERVTKEGVMETTSQRGRNLLLMLTLLSGGTLLLLPMKSLEDNKHYWVQKANHLLDKMRGSTMTPEEVEARDKKVEQDIACSPRQTWPSFLLGRVVAVSSSVITGTFLVGPKNNQKIMETSERILAGSVQKEKNMWHRYASLIGVETYSCAISSVILELMSKFSAKRGTTVHDPEICMAKSTDAAPTTNSGGTDEESAVTSQKSSKFTAPASYADQIRAQQAAKSQVEISA